MTMSDDAEKAVDLDVGGQDPIGTIRSMLSGYDATDASRVAIQIWEPVEDDGDADTTSGSTGSNGDGRSLDGIRENTAHHLVLAALAQADDPVSGKALADAMEHPDRNNVGSTLSKLWKRRLVDRDESTRPYAYQINSHGQAELDRLGDDVAPADVGGVWADE
jgi:hypothetical protein